MRHITHTCFRENSTTKFHGSVIKPIYIVILYNGKRVGSPKNFPFYMVILKSCLLQLVDSRKLASIYCRSISTWSRHPQTC